MVRFHLKYINIATSPFVQLYSDSDRCSLMGSDDFVLNKTDILDFFNWIVAIWNALPLSTRYAQSICSFKKGVVDFMSS